MSKRISAKHKIDRRLGVNLWGVSRLWYSVVGETKAEGILWEPDRKAVP